MSDSQGNEVKKLSPLINLWSNGKGCHLAKAKIGRSSPCWVPVLESKNWDMEHGSMETSGGIMCAELKSQESFIGTKEGTQGHKCPLGVLPPLFSNRSMWACCIFLFNIILGQAALLRTSYTAIYSLFLFSLIVAIQISLTKCVFFPRWISFHGHILSSFRTYCITILSSVSN